MSDGPEARLKRLGIELPEPPAPFATYRAAVRTGDLLVIAGQGPVRGREILVQGRVPDEVPLDQAREAARLSTFNALAIARAELGSLDVIRQVVQATVWVRCTDDFGEQPHVADGATEILAELFGADRMPARAAVGTNALPLGIPVEVAVTFEIGS